MLADPSIQVDLRLKLVGLNLVTCSPDESNRPLISSNRSCEGINTGNSRDSVCAYILCDGKLTISNI